MTAGEGTEAWSVADVYAAAVSATALATLAEQAITPVVQDAVHAHGGTMVHLETRLKPEASLVEKILRDREPADSDAQSVVGRINDVLRYTTVLPGDNPVLPDHTHWETGSLICQALVSVGYLHIAPRRGWKKNGYKGRNERFQAPSGQRFELQIHTSATLGACDDTRELYEEMRYLDTTREREFELQERRDAVFALVPVPPGTPLI